MAKCSCEVWLNLINLFQSRILPHIQVKTKKKGLRCCILVLSQSRISDFLLSSGYYLPKNRGGQTYFAPFSVSQEGALPLATPKSTPMASNKIFSWCLSYTPIPLLLIETKLPLLKITLEHSALSCFGHALCFLPEPLNLSAVVSKSVISRLKKKPFW